MFLGQEKRKDKYNEAYFGDMRKKISIDDETTLEDLNEYSLKKL